ncbi:hypothetical protein LMTR13_29035 [Bradyrhizobium icense]|uniref:Gfo/Idh/MocA family oxidoreductase n=1 Tax=Bradyrhizobium icense TaxID=1274631 RepID=A0A1B1ULI1_9BRAD|nr:hypothetical protein LMTR13_29035 [Bradyrhizobium icense]
MRLRVDFPSKLETLMNQPLRIGIVGAGMVSRDHLIAWASISDQTRVVDCYRLSGWEALR